MGYSIRSSWSVIVCGIGNSALLLAKRLWNVSACGIGFEDVSCVVFGSCSAAAAYLAVFAYSTFAFEVPFVS